MTEATQIGAFARFRFFLRRFGVDPNVAGSSAKRAEMDIELKGKKIAIVGNSRALSEQSHGVDIETADIVIRINRAPMPNALSHGSKTQWLALAAKITPTACKKINPQRVLWMSPKRKRLPFWVVQRSGFYLHPLADYQALKAQLGAPPTTGAMMIDIVARSKAKSIDLYGFDFFASLSLTGSRDASQVPHDFSAEKIWVENLVKTDDRVTVNR